MDRDKDKSIIEKFTETMKGLADSAAEALKAEEPPKAGEAVAAYVPLSAEGLVSDPLLVPPFAAQPTRKKRHGAKRTAKRGPAKAAKKAPPKGVARKAAKKSASARPRRSAAKKSRRAAARPSVKKRTSGSAAREHGRQ